MPTTTLIEPHGGTLCELIVPEAEREALKEKALTLPSITLTPRQLCDIELLLNGGFSPLRGFLNRADYDRVVEEMRLQNGILWPMPITLDVSEEVARTLNPGDEVALRDPTGLLLAVMHVEDVWKPDKEREARLVFGTTSTEHPAVAYLMHEAGDYYVGGTLKGVQLPVHYDFKELRHTPAQLRAEFERRGWERIVAFQTRNPMHRAHKELTDRAAEEVGGHLLIHPVVGMTKPGDIDYYTRVRCYRKLLKYYPDGRAMLSLLPLAMRMGGPREAVWHVIIRKNYGCTHLIIGRDHAGPGKDSSGKPFYGPYDAQELVQKYQDELGIGVVPFKLMVYVPDQDTYKPIDEVKEGERTLSISGTELRRRLAEGEEIPEWFSYPEVVAELRRTHPPRHQQGFTVFFTGLSGSGKSTIANALMTRLLELTGRPVTLLDGDVVRTHLSKGLGFSKEDRSINVRRIGYVASEITKHRGIAICAPIAPYEADRQYNRQLISSFGGYIEVFVDTPLEVCEQRDVKGLYAKARAGLIKGFTGIDDPYEPPSNPEIVCRTTEETVEQCVEKILDYLYREGYLRKEENDA
jgi:sulfate adenylyltransferase